MGKDWDPFDFNGDGKVDWQDAFIFNEIIDNDENEESGKRARRSQQQSYRNTMSKGEEAFFTALGAISTFAFILWLISAVFR